MKPAGTSYNLARFDLVSIRLVVDCVQHGSLSAAARESHLALAAASRRIRELEDVMAFMQALPESDWLHIGED